MKFSGLQGCGDGFAALLFKKCIPLHFQNEMKTMKPNHKKPKKKHFSTLKSLLKADREKEIELYGKQVSMRPSKVHKSKKDYDRKKNKVDEREIE